MIFPKFKSHYVSCPLKIPQIPLSISPRVKSTILPLTCKFLYDFMTPPPHTHINTSLPPKYFIPATLPLPTCCICFPLLAFVCDLSFAQNPFLPGAHKVLYLLPVIFIRSPFSKALSCHCVFQCYPLTLPLLLSFLFSYQIRQRVFHVFI